MENGTENAEDGGSGFGSGSGIPIAYPGILVLEIQYTALPLHMVYPQMILRELIKNALV